MHLVNTENLSYAPVELLRFREITINQSSSTIVEAGYLPVGYKTITGSGYIQVAFYPSHEGRVGVSIVQDDDQTASAINYLEEIVANALHMYAPTLKLHYLDIFIDQPACRSDKVCFATFDSQGVVSFKKPMVLQREFYEKFRHVITQ